MLLYTNHCHCMMWFEPGKKKKKEKKSWWRPQAEGGVWALYCMYCEVTRTYYTILHFTPVFVQYFPSQTEPVPSRNLTTRYIIVIN